MKLLDLARYKNELPKIILPHEEWVQSGEIYTPEAIEFLNSQINLPQRDRRGHLSASSLGNCARAQQFTWIGLPQRAESAQRMGILSNGDFVHLRFQMAGLSAGWLKKAEVKIPDNPWGLRGTMDGEHRDGSVVEFKSSNSFGFRNLLGESGGAKEEHIFQVGVYLLTTGKERGYILYENKDNQELKEFTIERTEELMESVVARVERLTALSEARELVEPLSKCLVKEGWQYSWCAYRDHCLGINTWTQAEKIANEDR